VVLIAGAAFWAYVHGHPEGPVVNHAVSNVQPYQTASSG
jgi:hypothetical protein